MKIDLANWFEIIAAAIAFFCWIIRPQKALAALSVMLVITVGIEFSSKYFSAMYADTKSKDYLYLRLFLYSIFYNLVTLTGNLVITYYLLKDVSYKKSYLSILLLAAVVLLLNYWVGQGYKTYNNYSTVLCWTLLITTTLYKLRTFDESQHSRKENFVILLFLLTTFTYYTVNLPFFVFFQTIFKESQRTGVKIYRAINDNANYFLYALLSVMAVLKTVKSNKAKPLQKDELTTSFSI